MPAPGKSIITRRFYQEVICMERTKNKIEQTKDIQEVVEFECPHCHVRVQADRDKRGKKGFCPGCNYIIRIPKD